MDEGTRWRIGLWIGITRRRVEVNLPRAIIGNAKEDRMPTVLRRPSPSGEGRERHGEGKRARGGSQDACVFVSKVT
jgi:hypothetical protein